MSITVRRLRPDETRTYLEIHRASVRGIAARDYPTEIIDAWAPVPVTDAAVEAAMANPNREIRVAAIADGQIVGIGAVVPRNLELRACYVLPAAARAGVGRTIVSELENIARREDAAFLTLESSLTAQPFYEAMGYKLIEMGEHLLGAGLPMACAKMRKDL